MNNPVEKFNWVVNSMEVEFTSVDEPRVEVTFDTSGHLNLNSGTTITDYDLNNIKRGAEARLNSKTITRNSSYGIDVIPETIVRRIAQKMVNPQIKKVIFNDPATIVFWTDGTKTVVKCDEREQFDREKGLAMAFFKKMHGNKGHYFEEIKKWTENVYYE